MLLIGGTAGVGKSTTAAVVARRLGWACVSTDRMARHPGRPWGVVRPHVRRHYATLSVPELTAAQLAHYERLWPQVAALALAGGAVGGAPYGSGDPSGRAGGDAAPPVGQGEPSARGAAGSAGVPGRGGGAAVSDDGAAPAGRGTGGGLVIEGSGVLPDGAAAIGVPAVWLTAPAAVIEARIRSMSGYDAAGPEERAMVRAFVGRTLGYAEVVMADARRLGLPVVDTDRPLDEVVARVLAAVSRT